MGHIEAIAHTIPEDPCRDYIWLVFRSMTLMYILTIIFTGYFIQKSVYNKYISKYQEQHATTNSSLVSSSSESETDIEEMFKEQNEQFELSRSAIRNRNALNKSVKSMWFCFCLIIFVCIIDVFYIAYWLLNTNKQ